MAVLHRFYCILYLGKRKEKKRLEPHNSLNVACLKRLLPIGLGFFSGREQELLQHAKHKLMKVSVLEPYNSMN